MVVLDHLRIYVAGHKGVMFSAVVRHMLATYALRTEIDSLGSELPAETRIH